MNQRIYLSPPYLSGDEKRLLDETVDSNWIAPLGPQVEAFEAELADATGVRRALATSSGTAALHVALRVLGVQEGDVVIGSSFTFIGSVSPVRYLGAEPWFVDCAPETWNIDADLLEEALAAASSENRHVRAVIAVDLFGQCADYARIEPICDRYGVPLVEDAAEALGATYEGRPAGGFGRVGILSFNGNKIITTSGGGALVSDDEDLVERSFFLSNQARDSAMHYEHSEIGYNYRLSNLLAAVGRAQLVTLGERVEARRRVAEVIPGPHDFRSVIYFRTLIGHVLRDCITRNGQDDRAIVHEYVHGRPSTSVAHVAFPNYLLQAVHLRTQIPHVVVGQARNLTVGRAHHDLGRGKAVLLGADPSHPDDGPVIGDIRQRIVNLVVGNLAETTFRVVEHDLPLVPGKNGSEDHGPTVIDSRLFLPQ